MIFAQGPSDSGNWMIFLYCAFQPSGLGVSQVIGWSTSVSPSINLPNRQPEKRSINREEKFFLRHQNTNSYVTQ